MNELIILAFVLFFILLGCYSSAICSVIREKWDDCSHGVAFFLLSWLVVTIISYTYTFLKALDIAKELLQ